MNKLIRQFERESNLDVYALGLDRVKWETSTEKFVELIVRECSEWVNDNLGLVDEEARADLLKHFGV